MSKALGYITRTTKENIKLKRKKRRRRRRRRRRGRRRARGRGRRTMIKSKTPKRQTLFLFSAPITKLTTW
jgi:hypothetical protein